MGTEGVSAEPDMFADWTVRRVTHLSPAVCSYCQRLSGLTLEVGIPTPPKNFFRYAHYCSDCEAKYCDPGLLALGLRAEFTMEA